MEQRDDVKVRELAKAGKRGDKKVRRGALESGSRPCLCRTYPPLPHCSQRVPALNACLSHSTKLSSSICFVFARARFIFLF